MPSSAWHAGTGDAYFAVPLIRSMRPLGSLPRKQARSVSQESPWTALAASALSAAVVAGALELAAQVALRSP